MELARDLFARTIVPLAGGQGGRLRGGGVLFGPGKGGGTRPPNLVKVWFILTVSTIVVSGILIILSLFILGSVKPGFLISAILLAILIGWFFTFLASAKVVSTIFGALAGSGAHQIATGTGFISGLGKIAGDATAGLTKILPALTTLDQDFINFVVWLFIGIIVLICLPALFKN